jgi:membrane associated rhomboid family serine protease
MFPIRDTEPSYSRPVVTILIILLNVLVFFYEYSLDPGQRELFIQSYGLVPDRFSFANVMTSMFLHGGWMHIIGNMWFLWIFGDNIEDTLGHGKYLFFYLACGVVAGLTQYIVNVYSRVPMVGASGAIAGVMGAYMVKFPHSRIRTLVFFIFITFLDIPAWVMLIYWFGTQLLSGITSVESRQAVQGGTAFFAHVGGFIAGLILIKTLPTRERRWRRPDPYTW